MQANQTIHFMGVDASFRRCLASLARSIDATFEVHASPVESLPVHDRNPPECLVLDVGSVAVLPESALSSLQHNSVRLPVIVAGDQTNAVLENRLYADGVVAFVDAEGFPLIRSAVVASLEMSLEYE